MRSFAPSALTSRVSSPRWNNWLTSLSVCIPAIGLAGVNAYMQWNEHWEHWSHLPPMEERTEYPYQNLRTKNFPWGDGDKVWNTPFPTIQSPADSLTCDADRFVRSPLPPRVRVVTPS